MLDMDENGRNLQLQKLCDDIRKKAERRDFVSCVKQICEAMGHYPDAPQPHNLLGIVLEKEGDHVRALRHFRAAYALDPSYRPPRVNLERFGTFCSSTRCAYDESDCEMKGWMRYDK